MRGLAINTIILAGAASLILLALNVAVYALRRSYGHQWDRALLDQSSPAYLGITLARFTFLSFSILSLSALLAGVGLLLRANWARSLLIFIFVVLVIWCLSAPVIGYFVLGRLMPVLDTVRVSGYVDMRLVASALSLPVGILVSAYLIRHIRRLASDEVRSEFRDGRSGQSP